MRFFRCSLAFCVALFALGGPAFAQVNITTWQVNTQHTGNNANETILTPGTVSSPGNFGLLFTQPMDGQTYGQTLLVSGLHVAGTTHNVVYAATQHGSIYAFDADDNTGPNANPLWKVSLLPTGTVPVPQSVVSSADIPLELGITTTPVIDAASGTIYIVSKVQRTADTTYHQYLYALDLTTGATKFNSPVEIAASFTGTATGDPAVGGLIPFNPLREHMRSAMQLYNGILYLTYASHSDKTPYHGEIIGYNATTLQVVKTFITTPNGGTPEGGLWMAGASPAIDPVTGNLYVSVGNGAWDQTNSFYGTNWGESMLKLPTTGTFNVSYANTLSWFTPNIWKTLNNGDLDVGSGGLLLLPDQTGPHTHIMVGGGKGAVLYVVDRDTMGGLQTPDAAIQEISETNDLFTTPSYYNGYIYYSNSGGLLEQRAVGYNPTDSTYIATTPVTSTDNFNNMGSGCFISSNGTTNGIVWILRGDGLRAYNATNVSGLPIYTATATTTGGVGCQNTKFSLPMEANGKVYYTAYHNAGSVYTGYLFAYGLLPTAVGTPAAASNATAAANTSGIITVSWTDNSTNESGFKIKRSTSATTGFTQVGLVGAGITSYVDAGRTPSTAYYYQVIATNANGDANASNVASATTFPYYSENGLVAYWSMDETSGSTLADATGNGHTATIGTEAGSTAGFINNGVTLHGTGETNTRITVTNKTDLQFTAAQSFTLSAWVLPDALRGSEETIIAKSRDTGNYYGIWINANNQWVFRGPAGDVVGPAVTQGSWAHVTAVQDGPANTRTIYVNGVAIASGAAQAGDGTGDLWMGQQFITGNSESFPGTVDEVRVYNRALTANEITNLMGPAVLQAQSSQTVSAGTFGVTIWPYAARKIEPRKGAATGQYSLVLTFSAPVSGLTATLKTQAGGAAVGSAGAASYDATGKVVTVSLTGVGNAQMLNLHLAGIMPGNATADIPFSILWGEVNADNIVNALDVSIVKNSHTTIVNATSALYDINCDGAVNSTDDALVTVAVGTSLGAQTDTDLAIFQPATASSNNGAGVLPALAVDASTATRWESLHAVDPQYIYVNLGGICTVHAVTLWWETAAGQNYTIDVSTTDTSDSAWTTIKTITGNTTVNTPITYSGFNVPARYVRMNGTTRTGIYGYSLYDFQVIGLSNGNAFAPTINSASAATAATGSSFSYQITATNNPTSYGATNLPPGLGIVTSTGVISGTPTQAGTFTPTISATNGSGTNSMALTITVQAPFTAWQSGAFTAAELADPAVSGAMATPAGDGITNLMKYALNLNPKVSGTGGLPLVSTTTTGGQTYLTLTYTKVIAATDITYQPEITGDMLTWNSGTGYTTTVSATNNPDGKTQTVMVRDLTPESGADKRLIRLKVTKP